MSNLSEVKAYDKLRNEIAYNELSHLKSKLMEIAFENEKTNKQYAFGVWRAIGEIDKIIEMMN